MEELIERIRASIMGAPIVYGTEADLQHTIFKRLEFLGDRVLGLLPNPEGGLSDITGIYRDKCCPLASASLSKPWSKSTAGATCPKPSPSASPPSKPGSWRNSRFSTKGTAARARNSPP